MTATPATTRRSLFKHSEILPVPSYLNFHSSIFRNIFKHSHLQTILIQGISTTFIAQIPAHFFPKEVYL
jgi:hypothetical protein